MFVFVKQKTAYEMRISDWSSDVCSSDLLAGNAAVAEGNRVVLVAADDEAPASILLVVDEAIGIAQGRQVGRDAGDRLGHQVLVLDRAGGQVHAQLRSEERSVGKECVSKCRSREGPDP